MTIEQLKTALLLPLVDVGKAIRWYERAFFAIEQHRVMWPSGIVAHAQLEMLGLRVVLTEADWEDIRSRFKGGKKLAVQAVVEDADYLYHNAVLSGAVVNRRLRLGPDGFHCAVLEDPFGHRWRIAEREPWLADANWWWRNCEMMQPLLNHDHEYRQKPR